MLMKKLIAASGLLAVSQLAMAATDANIAVIEKQMATLGAKVSDIAKSPVDGIYEVMTKRGLLYVSADGRHVFQGKIYDITDGIVDISEARMAKMRKERLVNFEDSMLVFPAKNEKHQITVFTDVDCGYCRRLHSQMDEYNDLGITVRYLAFPRGGQRSKAWGEMQSVWCSKDPLKAMTDAKAGTEVASASCKNKVAEHYDLGVEFGVNGTPALILDDGSMLPGYQPPENLLKILNANS